VKPIATSKQPGNSNRNGSSKETKDLKGEPTTNLANAESSKVLAPMVDAQKAAVSRTKKEKLISSGTNNKAAVNAASVAIGQNQNPVSLNITAVAPGSPVNKKILENIPPPKKEKQSPDSVYMIW
jgi:hypothetical protein